MQAAVKDKIQKRTGVCAMIRSAGANKKPRPHLAGKQVAVKQQYECLLFTMDAKQVNC